MDPQLKDGIAKVVTGFHRLLFDVSGGWLLGDIGGMTVVKLTTVGRKSGQARHTMLTAPIRTEDGVVLVASWGGDDRHPQWFRNLSANPDVEATYAGRTRKMRARIASAEEKAEMWPRVVEKFSGYADYQEKTARDIPLAILAPR